MTVRQQMILGGLGTCVLIASVILFNLPVTSANAVGKGNEGGASLSSSDNLLTVRTIRAQLAQQVMRKRTFTGVIVAARTSQLSFEQPGRITSVLVDEGDEVDAGQVLAEIDLRQIASRLDAAKAAVRQATATLNELVKGPRPEVVASSRATLASAEAEVQRLDRDFERVSQLRSNKSISQQRFDATRFGRESSVARRDAAARQLDELLAGTRKEQIEAQRATLERLQSEQHTLELDLQDAQLKAPFPGRISQRFLDEGTVVAPGQATLELVEVGALEAWIGVPPKDANRLDLSGTYEGVVEKKAFPMTLRSLRPRLDNPTRTQNAVFEIAAPPNLVPGEIVRFSMETPAPSSGILLPTSALAPGPRGLWSAYVAIPNSAGDSHIIEKRNITLIETFGTKSLVGGTLQEGMQVIVDGVHRVVPGQHVRIASESEPKP